MATAIKWQWETAKKTSAMNNNPPSSPGQHMAGLRNLHLHYLLTLHFLTAK